MRYFCSYNYLIDGKPYFGNVILKTEVDPYDDIEGFLNDFYSVIHDYSAVLLFYKKVKS